MCDNPPCLQKFIIALRKVILIETVLRSELKVIFKIFI